MSRRETRSVTRRTVQHGLQMMQEWKAKALIICADVFVSPADLLEHLRGDSSPKILLVTRRPRPFQEAKGDAFEILPIPNVDLTRLGQIKMAVLVGLSRGRLSRGEKVICLSGVARSGRLDTILFMKVGEELEMFPATGKRPLQQQGNPEVFERVLDIAVELGQEGREGKPVGTIFVIGDTDRVRVFSEPLMLNPFQGHPEEERNILAPALRETMKELSALDGAFLIRDDGVVEAAGVFLRSIVPGSVLPQGLGTRHRSAAAITAGTNATAITVSESTGNVTVFGDGKIITEIEKPRAGGGPAREVNGSLEEVSEAEAEELTPPPISTEEAKE